VAGADLRAALVASCLRGAFPPVDLRAVCLVRAIFVYVNEFSFGDELMRREKKDSKKKENPENKKDGVRLYSVCVVLL
jgi:hypothetical protein